MDLPDWTPCVCSSCDAGLLPSARLLPTIPRAPTTTYYDTPCDDTPYYDASSSGVT